MFVTLKGIIIVSHFGICCNSPHENNITPLGADIIREKNLIYTVVYSVYSFALSTSGLNLNALS